MGCERDWDVVDLSEDSEELESWGTDGRGVGIISLAGMLACLVSSLIILIQTAAYMQGSSCSYAGDRSLANYSGAIPHLHPYSIVPFTYLDIPPPPSSYAKLRSPSQHS